MPAKCELNPKTVKKYIDLHLKLGVPFELTLSNYTTKIKSKMHHIHFMKNAQSNRTFAAFSKVKSDVVKKQIPCISPYSVSYFSSNIFEKDFFADVIYNIDLKAAYATVLLNDKFISKETYNYIMKLPKMERLICIGMLAGKKNIFEIDGSGNVIKDETIISATSDYFFYCVQRTYEIMNEARFILNENFLFSWVDGIYFLDNENKSYNELLEFFSQKGFKVSFDVLTNFYIKCKNTYYNVSYTKNGEKKFMNVPKKQNSIIKSISNYLLTKDY